MTRFYWADGHSDLAPDPDRDVWVRRVYPPAPRVNFSTREPWVAKGRDHFFRRREYRYPPGFEGPHRRDDFHED